MAMEFKYFVRFHYLGAKRPSHMGNGSMHTIWARNPREAARKMGSFYRGWAIRIEDIAECLDHDEWE